ncbi:unnamed protein product [Ceratitis capitata]|uniref:(Mediterranean fruit fly) hypothetical protein n=1 Tax=Ceratitis capitata TaxID=7213 RepID=A0A811USC6_CERCA|nr:unnamed protein product [Ceratitis capitata]
MSPSNSAFQTKSAPPPSSPVAPTATATTSVSAHTTTRYDYEMNEILLLFGFVLLCSPHHRHHHHHHHHHHHLWPLSQRSWSKMYEFTFKAKHKLVINAYICSYLCKARILVFFVALELCVVGGGFGVCSDILLMFYIKEYKTYDVQTWMCMPCFDPVTLKSFERVFKGTKTRFLMAII